MTPHERSLATVLFTDIVGSTERAAELRDAGWRELRDEHDRQVRRALRQFGGREINTAGDSFLATFDRPAAAIACADAIRSRVRELGLEVRAGLHMGEIERVGGDVGGLGVNIGARVAAEAGPGEILVSRTVRDALAGSAFDFEDRGVRALKGVPGEWRLFEVTNVPEGAAEMPGHWSRSILRRPALVGGVLAGALLLGAAVIYVSRRDAVVALTPEEVLAADAAPGIAVLPFTVNDPALETWREGMVDLLSINLDGIPGLRPIASRTVMARWREEVEGLPDLAATLQVARRTGARYALVGNAVAIGSEVRFAAEIYDARTGEHLGSAGAEGSPDSVFALVDRLSIGIVRALPQGEEGVLPKLDLASVTTTSLPALKSYLEGESAYRRADFGAAVSAYRRAVEADSTFALALLRLEGGLGFGVDTESQRERLKPLLDRLPERMALTARGNLLIRDGSFRQGIELLREAAQKHPDDADIWYYLGEAYTHHRPYVPGMGERDAVEAFSRTITLDESYSAAYIHLLDQAFYDADSARARELLTAYRRIAPEDRHFELTYALAFGPAARDARMMTALLDTVSSEAISFAPILLVHPRFQATERQLLQVVREQQPDSSGTLLLIARQDVIYGRIEEALDLLDDPRIPDDRFLLDELYILYAWGLPIPEEHLERVLVLPAGGASPEHLFYAGAYAAERGRWNDHATALSRLKEIERAVPSSDRSTALWIRQIAQALEGFGLWRQGRREDALRELEASRWVLDSPAPDTDATISIWLGRLLLEMGRPSDAVPYFRDWLTLAPPSMVVPAPGPEPLASFYLGKAYQAMNEREKALESFEFFAESWREADPELQPMVQDARQAAMRLERE